MSPAAKKHITADGRDSRFRKTQLCVFFQQGRCRFGEACAFAHNATEVEDAPNMSKSAMCKLWKAGTCPHKDGTCRYAHGKHELRIRNPNMTKEPQVSQAVEPVRLEPEMERRAKPLQHALKSKGTFAEPMKVLVPNVMVELGSISEPMFVTSSWLGIDGWGNPCGYAKSLSTKKSIGVPAWDQSDDDTAVGEISSEDDGSYSSPSSDSLDQFVTAVDLKKPPGLDAVA